MRVVGFLFVLFCFYLTRFSKGSKMSNSHCEYFSTLENICCFFTKTIMCQLLSFDYSYFIAAKLGSECRLLVLWFCIYRTFVIYSKGKLSLFSMSQKSVVFVLWEDVYDTNDNCLYRDGVISVTIQPTDVSQRSCYSSYFC